jgi:mannosidase alpha-like ER degradation enhancer 2
MHMTPSKALCLWLALSCLGLYSPGVLSVVPLGDVDVEVQVQADGDAAIASSSSSSSSGSQSLEDIQQVIQAAQAQAQQNPRLLEKIWETLQGTKLGEVVADMNQDPQNQNQHGMMSDPVSWFKAQTEGKKQLLLLQQQQQQQQQQQTSSHHNHHKQAGTARPMVATNRRALYLRSLQQRYVKAQQERILLQIQQKQQNVEQQKQQNDHEKQDKPAFAFDASQTAEAWNDWMNTHRKIASYTSATATASTGETLTSTTTTTVGTEQITTTTKTPARKRLVDRSNSLHSALPPFSNHQKQENRNRIRDMFQHAYDSYMHHAWPAAEVHPLTCNAASFDLIRLQGLTLIDTLDTLVVLGNYTEFARAVERLKALDQDHPLIAVDQNVSLFETNIRVLGGLLSAHQMAQAYFVVPASPVSPSAASTGVPHSSTGTTTTLEEPEAEQPQPQEPSQSQHERSSLQARVPKSHVWDHAGKILWGTDTAETKDQAAKCTAPPTTDTRHDDTCHSKLRGFPDCVSSPPAPPLTTTTTTASTTTDADTTVTTPGTTTAEPSTEKKTASKTCKNATSSTNLNPEDYWSYDGFLLELATDLGYRLLPAFDTNTGIPYGTINLLYGVPAGETPVASLAGGGTLTLEFELLSRLTGDDSFGKAAKLASRALWMKRSAADLLGKHINIQNGAWTEHLSGIGSNSDSYLEYLVKHYMMFPEDPDFWTMIQSVHSGIHRENRVGEWYKDVDMNHGGMAMQSRKVLESLMAFYPGMQTLLGEVAPAARTLNSFFMVREFLGFLPERFHFGNWRLDASNGGAAKHPLRPELLESCYFLHRATKDMKANNPSMDSSNTTNGETSDTSGWLWAADFALDKLDTATRAKCGYAGVQDLKPSTSGSVDGSTDGIQLMDDMPSFFLSETLKYLYLIFDDDNILHQDDDRKWIFTTEAHPIHHEPAVKPKSKWQKDQGEKLYGEEIQSLKTMLSYRLSGKRHRKSFSSLDLTKEKWTDHINRKSYVEYINTVADDSYVDRAKSKMSLGQHVDPFGEEKIIEPFIPPEYSWMDTLNDTFIERNIAHLALGDLSLGEGNFLRKACPNLYSSDFLWMQALNGGAVDYTEVYISSTNDDFSQSWNQFAVVGAGEALGFLGSGVYLGLMENEDESCLILEPSENKKGTGAREDVDATGAKSQPPNGELVEITNEFGTFEVSSFTEGGGFYIRHVDSDTTIITSFLVDEVDESKIYAMVDSWTGVATDKNGKKATPDSDEESTSDKTRTFDDERNVVFGDLNGNSFHCEVELYQKVLSTPDDYDNDESTNEPVYTEERLLARYPCAPALFGPTHMSRLLETNGISIEASVFSPVEGDEYGCKKPSTSPNNSDGNDNVPSAVDVNGHSSAGLFDEPIADSDGQLSCPNENSIQILLRGECTFQAKALNQKEEWNVAATIIINSDDDELFIMSVGNEEFAANAPMSVLMTGLDGEDLLTTMTAAREEDDGALLSARVSVKRQPTTSQEIVKEDPAMIHWPIVRGSTKKLQVFCRNGWGLQARQEINSSEWKLNLFRHETPAGETTPK